MSGGENDWIIEDSEEEDQLCTPEIDGHPSVSPIPPEAAISSINAFTSIPVENTSHISSVGADSSARPTISSFPPPPHVDLSTISVVSSKRNQRPRPRPIFGRTGADTSINTSISDPVFPHTPTSDAKDPRTAVAHSDSAVVKSSKGITDPESGNFSPDIAERAKMRARKATKRSSQYTEDIIDITDDDEFVTTPARKPKESRRLSPTIPVGNNPQLPSDPVTIPILSSSPLLPPSDPFPASTTINSTSPRPCPHDAVAAPDSSPQQSPVRRRKRKRTGHPHLPIEDQPEPAWPTTARDSVAPPLSDLRSPPEGDLDATGGDLNRNLNFDKKNDEKGYNVKRTPKKRKSSKKMERGDGSASSRLENNRVDKSRKKTMVEVVITSPRQQGTKKVKGVWKDSRNPEGTSSESRNERPESSPIPAELALKPVEDDAHGPEHTSDDEDELILAPKKQPSSRPRSSKEKQKAREPSSVDDSAPPGIEFSNARVTADKEEEELEKDEHHPKGASTSSNNQDHKSKSRPIEPETPARLQENMKPGVSVEEGDHPKQGHTRETPAPGKSRYTLSRFDPKTPMKELIRRATSHPNAPFSASSSPIASPLAKTSKSTLRRIAPLHTTRRTPPPPPPRPPPPKKSKKMLQLEEKWELELEDEVEGWWALTDEERQDWRRAKRDKELGFDD